MRVFFPILDVKKYLRLPVVFFSGNRVQMALSVLKVADPCPRLTYSVLSARYEVNQSIVEWRRPISVWRWFRSMWWSTVSNAAVRSRRMSKEGDPESAAIRRSLVTLNNAVSVLWAVRKPDWNISNSEWRCRCSCSCAATAFLSTLDRNGR